MMRQGRGGFRAGFGMVEMLAAVTVLSLGLLAIAALHARIASAGAQERARAEALAALHAEIEAATAIASRNGDTHSYRSLLQRPHTEPARSGVERRLYRRVWDAGERRFRMAASEERPIAAAEFTVVSLASSWTAPGGGLEAVDLWATLGLATPTDTHLADTGGARAGAYEGRALDLAELRALSPIPDSVPGSRETRGSGPASVRRSPFGN